VIIYQTDFEQVLNGNILVGRVQMIHLQETFLGF